MVRPWLSTIGVASFSLRMASSQPGLGCGFTPITPSGMRTRTLSVAAPSQPCGTLTAVLKKLSAGASFGTSVAWALAGSAAAIAATATAVESKLLDMRPPLEQPDRLLTSAPNPKFAQPCRKSDCELRVQKGH